MRRIVDRFQRLMSDVEWNVAIREHTDSPIEEQGNKDFFVIKNTWRYWCADPFLIEHEGKTYIFMEVYDRIRQRGFIGYRIWEQGKASKIYSCMHSKHHLSYPFLYKDQGEIFMIPECYQSGCLRSYRAVEFPDRWELAENILTDVFVCDSDMIETKEGKYLLSMEIYGNPFRYDRLYLYKRVKDQWKKMGDSPVVCGSDHARNGGAVFYNRGRMIRPAQDCSESYGSQLAFYQIEAINEEKYVEKKIADLNIDDITIVNSNEQYDGIHTYNTNGQYDVIDLRRQNVFQSARFFYLIGAKLKRLRRPK